MSKQMSTVALLFFALPAFSGLTRADDVASLCQSGEQTVWSCQAHGKVYSVCASKVLTATTGFMQYRAGTPAKVDFRYPAKRVHPMGKFQYSLLARGASLEFKNGGYDYYLGEALIGGDNIQVSKAEHEFPAIQCEASTESLTLTTTMGLMKSAGIYSSP